jgi:hypothetical protein
MKRDRYEYEKIVEIADRGLENAQKYKWKIEFCSRTNMPKMTWGVCNRDKKLIRVRQDLCELNFLDTLIHEIRHAQHPVLFEAEEFISDTSTELAAALLATGRVRAFPRG